MKKSSLLIILILSILAGISIYVYKTKSGNSTLNKEASNFKYKDTAQVDKIFIADKDGKLLTLDRVKGTWMVNNTYKARPDIMETLLRTIASVEVKSPVSKLSRENVIKVLASKSVKVEIYNNGNKVKQFYVGHTTQDHLGTYMLLTNPETDENYSEPFITHIPGFEGFLNTRFITDELDWRDRLVMSIRPPQIKYIKMDLHEISDSSYIIDLISMQRFTIKTLKGKNVPFEEDKIKQFIAYFLNINCENVLDEKSNLVDSLSKKALPFATITITDRDSKTQSIQLFHKQPNVSKNEQYGIDYKYDPDRLYIKYNYNKSYGLGQYYVFGKILQTYGYFMPKK
jgi:hypothetical protein